MKLLVDADVILDVALGREPWVEASGSFLDLCQAGTVECFVAWHSISNVYYVISPKQKRAARAFVANLLEFVRIAPVTHQDMLFALDQDLADLEDAMQVAAAVSCRASRIVTRNRKHYRKSIVPAVTPARLLAADL
jgi:predicted nucleic acid-binding protein